MNTSGFYLALVATAAVMTSFSARSQEPVVGVADGDALFKNPDPKLNANTQAAYHIMKDLLYAGHWDMADKYLTPEYHQHNPNAASGRDSVVTYFTQVRKMTPKPIPEKLPTPIVAVIAHGDYVVVVYPRTVKEPTDPSKTYTTTWFDMWRFKNAKADEHWDPATKAGN